MLQNLIDKIRLLFRKDRESYLCFYQILGFYPHNISIYQQALLHKSVSFRSENGKPLNNERLEFLGDAVLNSVVSDILYYNFQGRTEGFLTSTRSKIVQRDTLNKLAVEIGLDKLVKYGCRSSSHNSYINGNAFEALIGAIYLDRGYVYCQQFIEQKIIREYIDLEKMSRKEVNFKSRLIEWCQKNKFKVSFELIEQRKDENNNPIFQSEVHIEGIPVGSGIGYSKKESQQTAAHDAQKRIKRDNALRESIKQVKEQNQPAPVQSSNEECSQENIANEVELLDEFTCLSEADTHSSALNN